MGTETHVQLELRAYYIWEQQGRPEGLALEHWLEAQAEAAPETKPRRPKRRAKKVATTTEAKPAIKAAKRPARSRREQTAGPS